MTVKAIDTLFGVHGHLVFVDDRVLKTCVTFGAFSRRPDKVGGRLSRLDAWPGPVHEKSGQNERKGDDDSQEHGTKRHTVTPGGPVVCRGTCYFTQKQNTGNCNRLAKKPAPTREFRAANAPITRIRIDFEPQCD